MIHCVLNKDQILYMSHENGIRPLKLIKFPSASLFFIPVLASLMIPNWLQRSLRLSIHPLLCAEGEWQLACESFSKRVLILALPPQFKKHGELLFRTYWNTVLISESIPWLWGAMYGLDGA